MSSPMAAIAAPTPSMASDPLRRFVALVMRPVFSAAPFILSPMDTLCAPAALISASAVFIAAPNMPTFCMPWPSDVIILPTPP